MSEIVIFRFIFALLILQCLALHFLLGDQVNKTVWFLIGHFYPPRPSFFLFPYNFKCTV